MDSTMTTFGSKSRTRFGCWNKTMMEPAQLAQVTREINNYKLTFLGLNETRWNGPGEFTTTNGELLIYSGKPEGKNHESGVGLMISKDFRKCLINWKPISDRIIIARLQSKIRKVTVIQCYALIETSTSEQKNDFYDALSTTITQVEKSDILILIGDFNAKVGTDNRNLEEVVGTYGQGRMNDNGNLFSEL